MSIRFRIRKRATKERDAGGLVIGLSKYRDEAIPLERLYENLERLPAKEVVVMLDSCFSGATGRSTLQAEVRLHSKGCVERQIPMQAEQSKFMSYTPMRAKRFPPLPPKE